MDADPTAILMTGNYHIQTLPTPTSQYPEVMVKHSDSMDTIQLVDSIWPKYQNYRPEDSHIARPYSAPYSSKSSECWC